MYQQKKMTRGLFGAAIAITLISLTLTKPLGQQRLTPNLSEDKSTSIEGHVLAYVDTLVFGAGVGPQYAKFIFGVETKGTKTREVTPVLIAYAFHKKDGPPTDSSYDYSKRYELRVVREPMCDESVSALSYEKNEDETGKQLPPTCVLRFLEGAPKDLLKPDSVLPCYVLTPRNYQELK